MILAGIDIGTNSIRLIIAETGPGIFRELFVDRWTTRLGKDLERTGLLSSDAMDRSLAALREFKARILHFSVCRTAAVGTSALRNASNTLEFTAKIKDLTGFEISVISGDDEARLSLLGVGCAIGSLTVQGDDPLASALVIDIGGGSTELILTVPGSEPLVQSLPLGAVYLAERCVKRDPPGPDEVALLRQTVRAELQRAEERGLSMLREPCFRPKMFVGTAGTITTLSAMDQDMAVYDPGLINRSILTRTSVDRLVLQLVGSTHDERRAMNGLDAGREDIILPGAIVVQEIMERYEYAAMLVSDRGLLEGIVLDLSEKIAMEDASKVQTNKQEDVPGAVSRQCRARSGT